jgi:hypothetical protein
MARSENSRYSVVRRGSGFSGLVRVGGVILRLQLDAVDAGPMLVMPRACSSLKAAIRLAASGMCHRGQFHALIHIGDGWLDDVAAVARRVGRPVSKRTDLSAIN